MTSLSHLWCGRYVCFIVEKYLILIILTLFSCSKNAQELFREPTEAYTVGSYELVKSMDKFPCMPPWAHAYRQYQRFFLHEFFTWIWCQTFLKQTFPGIILTFKPQLFADWQIFKCLNLLSADILMFILSLMFETRY